LHQRLSVAGFEEVIPVKDRLHHHLPLHLMVRYLKSPFPHQALFDLLLPHLLGLYHRLHLPHHLLLLILHLLHLRDLKGFQSCLKPSD
jgi:hypothetical protein